MAILAISEVWARLGVYEPWPPGIAEMRLWRYSFRWDSGWYLGIVRFGYEYIPDQLSSVAFFPLFPLLMWSADKALPGTDVFAGLVVVHAALVIAVLYVYATVRLDYSDTVAFRTVFFLLAFPTAFFFSAIYTESLMLMCVAGSLYHARRGHWLRAGLFAAAASATKVVGFVMAPVLLIEVLRRRDFSIRRPWPLVSVLLAPLGGIAYFTYLQLKYGDFKVFFEVENAWSRDSFSPVLFMGVEWLMGERDALRFYPPNSLPLRSIFLLADTTLLWIFLIAGVILWLRVRPSYGALVTGMALVPGLSGSPQSLNRYLVVLFPAFILLAKIEQPQVRAAVAAVFLLGLAMTTYLFVQGFWAG
jgi:hypothetical protein